MTTPREALEELDAALGGVKSTAVDRYESVYSMDVDEILTALAPHFLPAGCVAVCKKCKSPEQSKFFAGAYHWSWSDCKQIDCPLKPKDTP